MKMKATILGLGLLAMTATASPPHSFVPKDGFVPNEVTAIRIAEAVWEPIYGKENIASHQPTKARLVDGVWIVVGSLPESVKGGVPLAEIRKQDGCILRVSHGK
jgi:hypothetical protein